MSQLSGVLLLSHVFLCDGPGFGLAVPRSVYAYSLAMVLERVRSLVPRKGGFSIMVLGVRAGFRMVSVGMLFLGGAL